MITLNQDQLRAKEFFKNWWDNDKRFAILEGCAGTGKTTIVKELVQDLKNCDPLFTAPTNEACRQLESVLPKGSLIRTTYSALNFRFKTDKEQKELIQQGEHPVINQINLLIIDECSMVGEELLQAILDAGKKTLFIGHRSQLPEVVTDLKIADDCESVIFKQEWPIYTLTTPERNKGELFEFINSLEHIIYHKPKIVRQKYNMQLDNLLDYIDSKEGRHDFQYEQSKLICWTNAEVDRFNSFIRKCIYHTEFPEPFLPKDKIIMLEPCMFVEPLVAPSKARIAKFAGSAAVVNYSANTKAIVRKVDQVTVLNVPCWELEVECEDKSRPLLYVPIDENRLKNLSMRLKRECYEKTTFQAKAKAFREYHFIMSIFAKVKHSYAITTHRSQGMTIPKVFVSWSDIKKCHNVTLRHKLLYVAASRAKESLAIIA